MAGATNVFADIHLLMTKFKPYWTDTQLWEAANNSLSETKDEGNGITGRNNRTPLAL